MDRRFMRCIGVCPFGTVSQPSGSGIGHVGAPDLSRRSVHNRRTRRPANPRVECRAFRVGNSPGDICAVIGVLRVNRNTSRPLETGFKLQQQAAHAHRRAGSRMAPTMAEPHQGPRRTSTFRANLPLCVDRVGRLHAGLALLWGATRRARLSGRFRDIGSSRSPYREFAEIYKSRSSKVWTSLLGLVVRRSAGTVAYPLSPSAPENRIFWPRLLPIAFRLCRVFQAVQLESTQKGYPPSPGSQGVRPLDPSTPESCAQNLHWKLDLPFDFPKFRRGSTRRESITNRDSCIDSSIPAGQAT